MYPRLVIDTHKVTANAKAIGKLCAEHSIDICGVTKGCGGDTRVAQAFIDGGIGKIGDSRLHDLANLHSLDCPKLLIRTPAPDEAADVVRLADASVNTEAATIKALEHACERQGIAQHGIVLMADLGDLREGFANADELVSVAHLVARCPHLHLHGLGANLNCLSFIVPDADKMRQLTALTARVERECGYRPGSLAISGGNSSNLHMLLDGEDTAGVTELRVGEALLVGRERTGYSYLPNTYDDAFVLQARIVELKDKPSKPWGTAGVDSYGVRHEFPDMGERTRAIVAFGHQDAEAEVMRPLDADIKIVDSSSDHTVIDLTDCARGYHVGDVVEFACGYHAIARAFISPYVEKTYL